MGFTKIILSSGDLLKFTVFKQFFEVTKNFQRRKNEKILKEAKNEKILKEKTSGRQN